MWIFALLAAATAEPRSVDASTKSQAELVECSLSTLAEVRGYEVQKRAATDEIELQLRTRILGVAKTVAEIHIKDLGTRREMTIFASGKKNGGPRVFAARARSCL